MQAKKVKSSKRNQSAATHWALDYINSAFAKGWINGYADCLFRPSQHITRAEVITIVNTMLNRNPEELPESFINPFSDIDITHWAYIAVMEAYLRERRTLSFASSKGGCIKPMSDRPYNAALIKRARELRKNATKQENRLWYEYLRDFTPRFTRQRIVGNYILDFYCSSVKLAVELDGSQHYEAEKVIYDRTRIRFLETIGIKVIRFTNIDVDSNFEGVCITISNQINALKGQLPHSTDGTPFEMRR